MSEQAPNSERALRGLAIQSEATGRQAPEPTTLWEESWREFVFAEIWARPKLDKRSRFIIAMADASIAGATPEMIDGYVRGAIKSNVLSQLELREAALHLAVYGGWSRGGHLDAAITRVCSELRLAVEHSAPLCPKPWDPKERDSEGAAEFHHVMTFPSGTPTTPYLEGMHNFVFAEMWRRRILDQRARRWITLVGVCESAAEVPIMSHIHAAMASGNCSEDEMQEFALQYGVHSGWPKASVIQRIITVMAKKVAQGLPWNG